PSSLRAWTLTLPSVVLRTAFSSLNVSVGLTASALIMARRVFSWMTRSKSGICVSTTSCFFAAADLATVAPCDDESEDDVQSAEGDAEDHVGSAEGDERGEAAEEHEEDAHDRDDLYRKCSAADECRAVQQQPHRGDGGVGFHAHERQRHHRDRHERRKVADEESLGGS